jgi:hypothetical protein
MIRFPVLAALALAALLPVRAAAQPIDPSAGTFRIVEVKVEKDKLTWMETKSVPVTRAEEVVVEKNGKKVIEKVEVTVLESIPEVRSVGLKALKATDGAGKAIAADKLAELLKEPTAVVMTSGPVPAKHRELFKEKTVFIEIPAPKLPGPPLPLPPPVAAPPKM